MLKRFRFILFRFPLTNKLSLKSVSGLISIKPSLSRAKSFENTFFPYRISEWNNLTFEIINSKSVTPYPP